MAVAYTGSLNEALSEGAIERKSYQSNPNRGGVVESGNESSERAYRNGRPDTSPNLPGPHNNPPIL